MANSIRQAFLALKLPRSFAPRTCASVLPVVQSSAIAVACVRFVHIIVLPRYRHGHSLVLLESIKRGWVSQGHRLRTSSASALNVFSRLQSSYVHATFRQAGEVKATRRASQIGSQVKLLINRDRPRLSKSIADFSVSVLHPSAVGGGHSAPQSAAGRRAHPYSRPYLGPKKNTWTRTFLCLARVNQETLPSVVRANASHWPWRVWGSKR